MAVGPDAQERFGFDGLDEAAFAATAAEAVGDDRAMLQARDEHGRQVRNPGPVALSRMVANLGRGNALIVERLDDEVAGDWYVQVWLRDDNTYQLEFRDGTAAEHYQTRTISQEKVIAALNGWAKGRPAWKDAFMWNNIGASFENAN
ncbi:hypothetical protein AB0451_40060 [Streptomyces sp. NPDC052000]|uniref:hypothetical protein n=1 Tax=Streptomyces sp. NPDC052000 TaxID=3155676 RepID=UPI00344F0E19